MSGQHLRALSVCAVTFASARVTGVWARGGAAGHGEWTVNESSKHRDPARSFTITFTSSRTIQRAPGLGGRSLNKTWGNEHAKVLAQANEAQAGWLSRITPVQQRCCPSEITGNTGAFTGHGLSCEQTKTNTYPHVNGEIFDLCALNGITVCWLS